MSELGKVIEKAERLEYGTRDFRGQPMSLLMPDQVEALAEYGKTVFAHARTLIAAAKRAEEAEAEVERLRNKIERDPVWFVPGKIVAHAGRCFKLRADDEGPKIVIERVAAVTCRSGEVTPPQTANAGATTLEGAGGEVRADAPSEAVEGV